MRRKIYSLLVNEQPGIKYRYHRLHDGSTGIVKIFSWLYLLWLNFAFYFLFMRFLGKLPEVQAYEVKRIPTKESESVLHHRECARKFPLSVDEYVRKLSEYDVVSFDIFDTLIFRPFALPIDLFRVVGEKLGILDFTNIRAWAEWDARMKCNAKNGHMEVTLSDIYDNLEEDVGISSEVGEAIEEEAELSLCYANPFMLEVWKKLHQMGKRIIVVSDMYLSSTVLAQMLENSGFTGYERLYVSCEYGKNKAGGDLFKLVRADLDLKPGSVIHVGDNAHSDRDMAVANGFASLLYPRIDKNAILYRAFDMSFIVGSAYRGLVTNHIYNGLDTFSMEYEYGYIYGGLFVTGYCAFIHDYCMQKNVDKILFLSRDGDILKQAYDLLFPEDSDRTEYVYWSRKAATTLMANEDKHDFFRRFIYHKVNQDYTVADVLKSMGLLALVDELDDWEDIWCERTIREQQEAKSLAYRKLDEHAGEAKYSRLKSKLDAEFSESRLEKIRRKDFVPFTAKTKLTDRNGYLLRRFIEAKWDKVLAIYETNQVAAERYYRAVLGYDSASEVSEAGDINNAAAKSAVSEAGDINNAAAKSAVSEAGDINNAAAKSAVSEAGDINIAAAKSAVAVDIGWAGSGAMALSHLVEDVWKIPCNITGIIAGTNTLHNSEPDASEPFLQSGKLVAYLYSQAHNRDLLKKHDLNKDYNIFWELLLSSPTPQFAGFYCGRKQKVTSDMKGTIAGNNNTNTASDTKEDSFKNNKSQVASKVVYGEDVYIDSLDITLRFGKYDYNLEGIRDVQKGILDFAKQYAIHFSKYPYMFNISGRDAYAPMLLAASHNEKYLKAIEKKFDLEVNVS